MLLLDEALRTVQKKKKKNTHAAAAVMRREMMEKNTRAQQSRPPPPRCGPPRFTGGCSAVVVGERCMFTTRVCARARVKVTGKRVSECVYVCVCV